MWALRTNVAGQPRAFVSGGIVILDDGRIFGGDDAIAYMGTFSLTDAIFAGSVRIWNWNPTRDEERNVFDLPAPLDIIVALEGTLGEDRIEAVLIAPDGGPSVQARLDRIADLPARV